MTGNNVLWFSGGALIGFLVALFTMDRYYKNLMKMVIDEIHKGYKKTIESLVKQDENDI